MRDFITGLSSIIAEFFALIIKGAKHGYEKGKNDTIK